MWLPHDLDTSAEQQGALVRKREVKPAADLLRLLFAYSLKDHSLEDTAIWADVIVRLASGNLPLRTREGLPFRLLNALQTMNGAVRQEREEPPEKKEKASSIAERYVFVFTALPSESVTSEETMEIYRYRWQTELSTTTGRGRK